MSSVDLNSNDYRSYVALGPVDRMRARLVALWQVINAGDMALLQDPQPKVDAQEGAPHQDDDTPEHAQVLVGQGFAESRTAFRDQPTAPDLALNSREVAQLAKALDVSEDALLALVAQIKSPD